MTRFRIFSAIACLLTICPTFGISVIAQDEKKVETSQQLSTIILKKIPSIIDLNQPKVDQFTTVKHFDVDGDGRHDLALQTKSGRGMMSSYYTVSRLVVVNGGKLLKGGRPMDVNDQIHAKDLLTGTLSVDLCSVGGSLMFPNESYEKFSHGNWWGKINKGLAMAIVDGDEVRIGYAKLSVTKLGEVSFCKSTFVKLDLGPITFEAVAE